ncbi:MAG: hypothetical protein ACR2OZ_07405 [Verrucomicrobiales bacterium]
MATTTTPIRRTRFSRRIPDHVTDELVNVLSKPRIFEFNQLFGLVYENLKKRNAVSGGEEMLRLRAYEKLQNLVSRSLVEKVSKTYRGLAGIQSASSANQPKPVLTPALGLRLVTSTVIAVKPVVSVVKPVQVAHSVPLKATAIKPAAKSKFGAKVAAAKAPAKTRVATTRSKKRAAVR